VIVDGTLAELIPAEELEGLYTGLDALRTIRERQEGLS